MARWHPLPVPLELESLPAYLQDLVDSLEGALYTLQDDLNGRWVSAYVEASEILSQGSAVTGVDGLPYADRDATSTGLDFDPTSVEAVAGIIQLPYNMTISSSLVPALVLEDVGIGTGDAVWELSYEAVRPGLARSGTYAVQTFTVAASGTAGTTHKPYGVAFGNAGLTGGDLVFWKLKRLATDAADTLGDDARLLGVEFNYITSRTGRLRMEG